MGDTLVILPTFNERDNIIGVLEGVLGQGERYEALVVDDMSPDGTAEAVRGRFGSDARVHLIEREGPKGRGHAGAAGFRWGLERDYKYIFEMDADGSHGPEYLNAMSDALKEADVAIASRLVPGGGESGRSFIRGWITSAANAYLRVVLGLAVRDCTTGYRGFRREALQAVPWDRVCSPGPSIVQEILYAVISRGFVAKEVPFMFRERIAGESKLNFGKLVAGLVEAFRIRRRMSPRI